MTGHLRLDNLSEGYFLKRTDSSSLGSHLLLVLFICGGTGLVKFPPSMLVYQLISPCRSCSGIHIVETSLSCLDDISSSRHPGSQACNISAPLPQCSLGHRCRSGVVEVPTGARYPTSTSWFCVSFL